MKVIKVAIVDERVADKKVFLVGEFEADAFISVVDEFEADMKVAIVSSPFYADMKVAVAVDIANKESNFYKLYTKAKNGDAESQYQLALCYDEGNGIKEDKYEAFKWFKEAALRNHAKAQNALGICYENGDGCTVNLDEAMRWYQLSIDNGLNRALLPLAGIYLKKYGSGAKYTVKNLLERAAALGDQDAKDLLVKYSYLW